MITEVMKWAAIDILYPKHKMYFTGTTDCSDAQPCGHGNFGCKRCQAINDSKLQPLSSGMVEGKVRKGGVNQPPSGPKPDIVPPPQRHK